MGKHQKPLSMALTVFLSSVFSLSLTHYAAAEETPPSTHDDKPQAQETLTTLTVKQASLPKVMRLDGQVESVQKATISAQTNGTIEQ
ncbi:MAG: hypothetical protein ACWA5U_09325, partial [bacterium]